MYTAAAVVAAEHTRPRCKYSRCEMRISISVYADAEMTLLFYVNPIISLVARICDDTDALRSQLSIRSFFTLWFGTSVPLVQHDPVSSSSNRMNTSNAYCVYNNLIKCNIWQRKLWHLRSHWAQDIAELSPPSTEWKPSNTNIGARCELQPPPRETENVACNAVLARVKVQNQNSL